MSWFEKEEDVFVNTQGGEFLCDSGKTPLCRLKIANPHVTDWVEINEADECRGMTDVVDVVWLRLWTDRDERIVDEAIKASYKCLLHNYVLEDTLKHPEGLGQEIQASEGDM